MSAQAELQHLLSVPPPALAHLCLNPIAVAHAVLQDIRDRGDPQNLFLRCLVEGCADEELSFHCISGARQVALWNWGRYSSTFLKILREYFMCVGHSLSKVSKMRQVSCYISAAAFWKRTWKPGASENKAPSEAESSLINAMSSSKDLPNLSSSRDLFQYLESLFQHHPLEAALFTSCLVTEFGSRSVVSYRLPIEFHKEAHQSFEKNELNICLEISMAALGQHLGGNDMDLLAAVVQLMTECIYWEFGVTAFDAGGIGAAAIARTLIRPPGRWRYIILEHPDFIHAVFQAHTRVEPPPVKQILRQLILALASLSGPIFENNEERKQFATQMVEGNLHILRAASASPTPDSSDLLDGLQITARIISNFRLQILSEISGFSSLLEGLVKVGTEMLSNLKVECEKVGGDMDSIEDLEWREEILALVLECCVVLSSDPWLLYSGSQNSRKEAQLSLSSIFGPLYQAFVGHRSKIAAMEEFYIVKNGEDLDETREEICASELEEELSSLSALGRLNVGAAIECLSYFFGESIPRLQLFWDGSGEVTPDIAALLEECRLLTLHICYLLTDDNKGETPAIPEAIIYACSDDHPIVDKISSAIEAVLHFANLQAQKISSNPANIRLSPVLASSFLLMLSRWCPAYMHPMGFSTSNTSNPIILRWSTVEQTENILDFILSLCLTYQCFWPHENQVQLNVQALLLAIARRKGQVRETLTSRGNFHKMVRFHFATTGLRHSIGHADFESHVTSVIGKQESSSMEELWGYHRLSYANKAGIFSSIIIACSDDDNERGAVFLNETLKALHESFTQLADALSANQVSASDIHGKETACVCIELFIGVVHTSEMSNNERIPEFMTRYLPMLSGLMKFYADDLTVSEALLRLFRDYTEQFISILNKEQSIVLFKSSAELLHSYSSHHCRSRAVVRKVLEEIREEEEQNFTDISCVLQLLINLGTKDFIDACSPDESVGSSEVTDTIFFGLHQILPLMTQGLLQYPSLCSQFFELVGFMIETYPEKVCSLSYEVFDPLLQALMFGISNQDPKVADHSLLGIASIAKEHMKSQVLARHLEQHPHIFYSCAKRLLTEVVFHNIVTDRMDSAAMALLPLISVDVNVFSGLVEELCAQLDPSQQNRLREAFVQLAAPDIIAKTNEGGYNGRMVRNAFKKAFTAFVNDVHSFILLK